MNAHQKANKAINTAALARPIRSLQTGRVVGWGIPDRKTGANVPHMVYITKEMLEVLFGDNEEKAFYAIRAMQRERLLPRMGSESRPLKARDFELYMRNKALGERHWQWIQSQGQLVRECTGWDSVWGYGYRTPTGFIIVDSNDEPHYVVENNGEWE